ncbi:MAG TPA: FecR domain-containing protein [Methylomirabilota bacterium]|nr:FecR domain-containing protein [Methylomirabilota bacterium]
MSVQAPIDPKHAAASGKEPRVEVYWTAVTYKTVIVYALILLGAILGVVYLISPDLYSSLYHKASNAISTPDTENLSISQMQAKFVNLDGKVQIKKVNSVQWVTADYKTTLDKGDFVQTGSDSAARITFADGTTYTVKSDTLVTVEENSMASNRPTSVAMRISTGSVDLATPNWSSPGSKAAVNVEDASAQLRQNSRASVKNDPDNNNHEIVVSTGSAEVQRGDERIELTQWEKASFPTGGGIQRSNVLAPPSLVEPLNLAPIINEKPKISPVHFVWKSVEDAVSYTVRLSATTSFRTIVKQAKVSGTSADITGLDPGEYFWNVTAQDAKKQTSEVSETFQFTLVAQGKSQDMMLEIEGTQLHGRVAEIVGRTEPGAALIVNGQSVPNIAADGQFRHFTEPLEPGQHTISIIGSNRRGGTAQQTVSIVVPK